MLNHFRSIQFIKLFVCIVIFNLIACNNPSPPPVLVDTINADDRVPPPPPPPPPVDAPGIAPPPPPSIQEEDGVVINYGNNKDGDIDKIIVRIGNDSVTLHFPPHAAKKLLTVAIKNSPVHILFDAGNKPVKRLHADTVFELISLASGIGSSVVNVREVPPPPPAPGNKIVIRGRPVLTQQNAGQHYFILSGKLVAMPQHASESLLPLIQKANTITVNGYERSDSDGFVNITGLMMVRPFTITIDTAKYVIR